MPPSAGWGAVRHRPRQKIGAKLNQSILEMALVSRCQGERLQERDQAGAGRRGPGGRHRCRGTAGCLLTPPPYVGYGGCPPAVTGGSRAGWDPQPSSRMGSSAIQRGKQSPEQTACLSFPTLCAPLSGEGGQLHPRRDGDPPRAHVHPSAVPRAECAKLGRTIPHQGDKDAGT